MLESLNSEEAVHILQETDDCPRSVIQNGLSNKCLPGLFAHNMYHLIGE